MLPIHSRGHEPLSPSKQRRWRFRRVCVQPRAKRLAAIVALSFFAIVALYIWRIFTYDARHQDSEPTATVSEGMFSVDNGSAEVKAQSLSRADFQVTSTAATPSVEVLPSPAPLKATTDSLSEVETPHLTLARPITVHGLRPRLRAQYAAGFKCEKAIGGIIPPEMINDGYCDCPDAAFAGYSTDEPGTSACASITDSTDAKDVPPLGNGRGFYCGWDRTDESIAKVDGLDVEIFSSRVNDGICDCCNGADEGPLHTTLCPNRCLDTLAELEASLQKQRAGWERRQEYIIRAQSNLQHESGLIGVDGGEDGVFLALAKTCWRWNSGHYEYEVCPYRSASQREGTAAAVVLARVQPAAAVWKAGVLFMGGGANCPGHGARSIEVLFRCGVEDALISVEEFETCHYTALFETPAACENPDS